MLFVAIFLEKVFDICDKVFRQKYPEFYSRTHQKQNFPYITWRQQFPGHLP